MGTTPHFQPVNAAILLKMLVSQRYVQNRLWLLCGDVPNNDTQALSSGSLFSIPWLHTQVNVVYFNSNQTIFLNLTK